MAIITRITVQQKLKDRYNIFLDKGQGEEYAFSVNEAVLVKFQLRKGMEIDEFEILEIEYQDRIQKAYQQSILYLSRRMRSELEVRTYLEEKEVEEPVIQEVIHKLKEQKYINDEEFALAYVRTQLKTTDKGKDLILKELREKGIIDSISAHALKEYSDEEELEKGKRLLEKFFIKNKRDSARVLKQKGEQYLLRKGYSFEAISRALSEVKLVDEENDEWVALQFQGEKAHRKYKMLEGYEYDLKMKQFLFRKGFSIDAINRYLAFKKNDELG